MRTYLVGGAVRDKLLGLPVKDRDWLLVDANPEELVAQGYKQVGKDFPVFLHPKTKEEYAMARVERKTGVGYHGFKMSTQSVTLEEDLSRRDLTINAMAIDEEGQLIDPYKGQADIKNKILRHVSPAFAEDPLRVLRVARLAARLAPLGFRVASSTLELMRQLVDAKELDALPGERVLKETERAIMEAQPEVYFQILEDVGALASVMPEMDNASTLDVALKNLQAGVKAEANVNERFALMWEAVPSPTRQPNFFHHLPSQVQDAVNIMSRDQEMLFSVNQDKPGVSVMLDFLDRVDAFRRPERLQFVLKIADIIQPNSLFARQNIKSAYMAASQVKAMTFVSQGLKGAAVGEAIKKARLDILAVHPDEARKCRALTP